MNDKITATYATFEETPIEQIITRLDSQMEWFDLKNCTVEYVSKAKENFTADPAKYNIPTYAKLKIPYKTTTIEISLVYEGYTSNKCGVCLEKPIVRPYRKTSKNSGKRHYKYSSYYKSLLQKINNAYEAALPAAEGQHTINIQRIDSEKRQQEQKEKEEQITQQLLIETLGISKYTKTHTFSNDFPYAVNYNERNSNQMKISFNIEKDNYFLDLIIRGKYTIEETKKIIDIVNHSQNNVLEKIQGRGI